MLMYIKVKNKFSIHLNKKKTKNVMFLDVIEFSLNARDCRQPF